MAWYSRRSPSFTTKHIVIGQYLGFTALVLVSIIVSFGALLLPLHWIGFLGLLPIYLAIRMLIDLLRKKPNEEDDLSVDLPEQNTTTGSNLWGVLRSAQTYKVASVTFANGADNIAIYTPIFASANLSHFIVFIVTFFASVGLWCFTSFKMISHPLMANVTEKYGHIALPFILIALGIYILISCGTVSYIVHLL
jgi:cadmium resistance transport/sequestration family protein